MTAPRVPSRHEPEKCPFIFPPNGWGADIFAFRSCIPDCDRRRLSEARGNDASSSRIRSSLVRFQRSAPVPRCFVEAIAQQPMRPAVIPTREVHLNNNMRDDDMQDSDPEAVSSHARRLAEQGLHEQAQGHDAEADRLLSQALSIDPGAVDAVLQQHDAARAPDARDQATSNRDVDRIPPRS